MQRLAGLLFFFMPFEEVSRPSSLPGSISSSSGSHFMVLVGYVKVLVSFSFNAIGYLL